MGGLFLSGAREQPPQAPSRAWSVCVPELLLSPFPGRFAATGPRAVAALMRLLWNHAWPRRAESRDSLLASDLILWEILGSVSCAKKAFLSLQESFNLPPCHIQVHA